MRQERLQDIPESLLELARKQVYDDLYREALAARDAAQAEFEKFSQHDWKTRGITIVHFAGLTEESVASRRERAEAELAYREGRLELLADAEHVHYDDFGDKSGIKFRMEGTLANGRRILMERDYDRGKGGEIFGARYNYRLENQNRNMRKMTSQQRGHYLSLKLIAQHLNTAARERAAKLL